MEFKELNLHPDLQRGIAEAGYVTCMPVQEQVLANAFNGQDLYVQSQTGTGKTAAFLVVIFQRLLTEDLLGGKKAIIMVPTRELAVQVEEEAKSLGKYLPFKVGSFYGGVGYTQQLQTLRENAQILVGTPGRVLDLNKSGQMNLMDAAFLVLDEADRMFDMGFYPDLRKLIKVVPPADRRQTMLFSATLNAWVKNLAWEYTKNPFEIEIEPETVTVDEVDQMLYHVPSADKMRLLLGILEREKPESAIIFCNTKRYTEVVAKRLRMNGYECEFIIGDLPQSRRLKIIDDVKAGNIRYLVATDVAARGLDIEGLSMVLNYDLPAESENYVHRIGRTARAGKTGKAITLASEQDVYELPDIEKYIGKKLPSLIAGEDLYAEDKSAGLRIRTEFFGDGFFGGRGESGHGRHGERNRRDGRGEGDSGFRNRGGAAREDRRFGGRGQGANAGNQGRRAEGADSRPDTGRAGPGAEDLSKLPFEQRMTYYRQKYKGPQAPGHNRETAQGAGKDGRDSRPRTEKPAGQTGREGSRRYHGRARPPARGRTQDAPPAQAGGNSGGPARDTAAGSPARPRNNATAGHRQGPRKGARNRGAANKPGSQTPRPDQSAPSPAGGTPGSGKGFLGKLLSIFKKKE
ncbi:MAG: DEAD/DEAH box helicase [Treponema sp.]|jgi:ATP-dependent RNA helicase RhlB|nr:DEAD/DEAH box helicase [Treponema sp.]